MKTKPNKKTWIMGKSASGKPSFPPVVPWITPQLKDQLVEMLVRGMQQRNSGTDRELQDIEHEMAGLQRLPALSAVGMRQLRRLEKRRTELLGATSKTVKNLQQKMEAEVANFCLLRGVRSVSTEDEHKFLSGNWAPAVVFTTAPIKINGVVLGTYDIYLDPTQGVPYNAFDLKRRDRKFPRGYHPHFTSRPCYGSFGPILQRMLGAGMFASAAGTYLKFLATYNGSSPLLSLSTFRSSSYANYDPLA
jgi:hypothetical protein